MAGESYGGIYVPYLAKKIDEYIVKNKDVQGVYLPNLKGFIVGNGLTSWKYDITPAYFHLAYFRGLIDYDFFTEVNNQCDFAYVDFENKLDAVCLAHLNKFRELTSHINMYDVYGKCHFNQVATARHFLTTPSLQKSNLRAVPPCIDLDALTAYLQRQDVL